MVNANGEWINQGYKEANEAMRRKQDKEREATGVPLAARGARGGATTSNTGRGGAGRGGQNRGGGATTKLVPRGGGFNAGRGGRNPQSNSFTSSTLWIHLIGLLKKKELLPVVIFTFSKKRCEENAGSMPNTDLCTSTEKSEVHLTIERSLVRLKGEYPFSFSYSVFRLGRLFFFFFRVWVSERSTYEESRNR